MRSGRELAILGPPPIIVDESIQQNRSLEEGNEKETRTVKKPENTPVVQPSDQLTLVIPYPQQLRKSKLDKHFSKFIEVFKKLHINIQYADALEQILSYVKLMKDILANKRNLVDYETVALTEECSAILQRKITHKMKDTESFTIPFFHRECSIRKGAL